MSEKGDYKNKVVTGVSPTQGGHFSTMPFDARVVEAFRTMADESAKEIKAGKSAGKFLIRKRTEDSLNNPTNRSKAPYFLEYVPASEVQAYEAKQSFKESGSGL